VKIHFLSHSQTPLSSPETSLLESVKAEILRRPDFVEVFRVEEADAIVLQEATSFKEWRYIAQLQSDSIVGKFPHKIYTINTDDSATGLLRGIYTSLPAHRFDPRLHRTVPYAASPVDTFYSRGQQADRAPKLLGSWRGNPKSNRLRRRLLKTLAEHPRFQIENTESWFDHPAAEKERYVDLLLSAKFSLCPAGWAGVTFRIYESMALGVCPVILADSFVPPQGPDWPSFSLRVPENKIGQLESILTQNENRHAEMGRRAREAWEQYFSPATVFGFYADALIACLREPRSREAELKRWHSFRMHWNNRWTFPQRLQIKLKKLASKSAS
jgi:hypothetical protein